jgi:cytochrome P450
MSLPPGPRLPPLTQSVLLALAPQPFLDRCQKRYGDLFTLRASGLGTFVVVGGPDEVRAVFTADPGILRAGEANAPLAPLVGRRSVLLLDGPEHLRRRKLVLPPFHGARMRSWETTIERVTRREVESWPVGRAFPLLPAMQAITLEVIVRAVFGVHEAARHAELSDRLRDVLEPMGSRIRVLLSLLSSGSIGDGGSVRRFEERLAEVDRLVYAVIAERRRARDLADRTDILSGLLLGQPPLTDRELRDELVTLLVAGHETTATALAWGFERLLRHPGVRAELERSLAAGETDYLAAVVDETLRLRPVLPNVGRVVARPWSLGGYELPAGITVLPSITLLHRRADSFPQPRSFRPERFLGGRGRPDGYRWIPFGGGTRRCLGASFAQFEMQTVIRTVLDAAPGLEAATRRSEKILRRGVTLSPGRGGRAILRRPPGPGAAGRAKRDVAPAPRQRDPVQPRLGRADRRLCQPPFDAQSGPVDAGGSCDGGLRRR